MSIIFLCGSQLQDPLDEERLGPKPARPLPWHDSKIYESTLRLASKWAKGYLE